MNISRHASIYWGFPVSEAEALHGQLRHQRMKLLRQPLDVAALGDFLVGFEAAHLPLGDGFQGLTKIYNGWTARNPPRSDKERVRDMLDLTLAQLNPPIQEGVLINAPGLSVGTENRGSTTLTLRNDVSFTALAYSWFPRKSLAMPGAGEVELRDMSVDSAVFSCAPAVLATFYESWIRAVKSYKFGPGSTIKALWDHDEPIPAGDYVFTVEGMRLRDSTSRTL